MMQVAEEMRGGLRTRSSGLSSGGLGQGAPQRRSIDLSGDGVHKHAPHRLAAAFGVLYNNVALLLIAVDTEVIRGSGVNLLQLAAFAIMGTC